MKKCLLSLLLVFVMVLGMFPVAAFAADVPFTVTADGEAAELGYVGEFTEQQLNSGKIPVYHAQVSEAAKISVTCDSGYVTLDSYCFFDATLQDVTKDTLEPYFTTASNYGLTTENSVAYVEIRNYDFASVCGVLIELMPAESSAPVVPFTVTADGEAAALSYVGEFTERQYNFSQIPVYYAQVSESAKISVICDDGYKTFASDFWMDAVLEDMTKDTLEPYFTTASNYGLTTENSVAYVEIRNYDFASVCGVLIELMPAESSAPDVPFIVTADGEAAELSYVGEFTERQYNFSKIPVYYAQVSESAKISVICDDGYKTFASDFWMDAVLEDMTKDTLAPYFTTASNYGLTTENSVAYVEIRNYDFASVCGVLIELVPVSAGTTTYTVTLPTGEGYTVAASGDSVSPVAAGGSYSFTVTVADGYDAANMTVLANDSELTAVNGVYTIENISEDQTVTVTGVEKEAVPPISVTADGEACALTVHGVYQSSILDNETEIPVYMVSTNDGAAIVINKGANGDGGGSGSYRRVYKYGAASGDYSDLSYAISVDSGYVVSGEAKTKFGLTTANTVYYVEVAVYSDGTPLYGLLIELEPAAATTTYAVTLPTGEGYTAAASGDSMSPVQAGGSYSFTVTVADGYDGTNMVVKANDTVLNAADGVYTIENINENQTVTVTGVEKEKIFEGAGTAEDPYLIKSAEDLVTLSQKVAAGMSFAGEYFKMTADITLPADWTPLGVDKNAPFSGNFDGGNYLLTVPEGGLPLIGTPKGASLSNLNVYGSKIAGYGVVNNYCEIGKVHAITIENVTLKSGTQTLQSGFIGGYASGSDTVTIRNCTVEQGVVIGYDKAQKWVGSFAGEFNGTIENCVSYATVYGTDFVGGIVSNKGQSMGTFNITNCQFHGDVVATGNYVGGIVGHGYGGTKWGFSSNAGIPTITNCTATGSVIGGNYVGGIYGGDTGAVQVWDNAAGSITGNSFTGTVSATGGEYVGAIIGYLKSLNKNNTIANNFYIANCGAEKGIGYVMYVDTSCETHETESGANYFNTAEGKPGITGVTKTNMNRTDDPLGTDTDKLCYTDTHTDPIAVELKISGTYKTTYTTGDKLDLSGIVLTVVYNDQSEKTVALSDVTVTGYDANKVGEQELTISYNGLSAAITVKVENPKGEIKVTVSVYGDSKHGDDGTVHTLSGGGLTTWVSAKTYTVDSNSTVWDVLQKAFADNGITCNSGANNAQGTVYISSLTHNGVTLSEFDNGPNSGWMYTLNGNHSDNGIAQQYLNDGDVIIFHYSDDYTKEQGSSGDDDEDTDVKAAEAVEKLIDAIGTVTLNSKSKIDTARKAYDALTYTQKQLVDNYATLTAAESKYAQLKAADDEKKASAVEDLIDAIQEGSTTFEDDVKAAQNAYNNLTADQKELVDNYYKLVNHQKELADEEDKEAAEAVEKLIEDLGTITLDSEEDIQAAREAYEKLTDEQKALVEDLSTLEAAEKKLEELKALAGVEDIYKTTGDYLENLGTPVPGSTGGEWMVIGLSRSGREIAGVEDYYASVVQYVQQNIDENERLHSAKSTENSRLILALTAIGKDVTNVDGHDLLKGLNSMEFIQKQGINGPIWALIAFDSGNYPTPEGDVTREALIEIILDAQLADGGWALSGETSDADITGMAVQALAPYYETNADVKAALDKAVVTLSEMQISDGSFGSIDGTSSESIAQVITALAALGIDADKDERFVKNGISALDALCAFYVQGGGFKHLMDGKLDGMATEQGYYALTAYFRMLDGKTSLYDMTDVTDMGGDAEVVEPTETLPTETEPVPTEPADTQEDKGGFPWWIIIVILVAGAMVVVIVNRKKIFANVR